MSQKILIVEDDININNMILEALKKEGYECIQAFSGTEALLCTKMDNYQLIVLDLMLPGMNGEEFMKQFRSKDKTPVIILSAKDELDSKVELLSMGADDYLTKPFELRELIARIQVQLRRKSSDNAVNDDILQYKHLSMNKTNFSVSIDEVPISFTRQEFKILELLLNNPKKIFSKQEIYNYAWDDYYLGEDKTINVHISNIRSKLKKYAQEDYIDTVWGVGFRLSP